ncbi:hypothetical protein KKF34_20020 [Myxococcota bacterium]|nr:hypothetical protein [Myxococcota bacterium]MBU1382988.1 hypothetical protein [Myxococcota bacterium]MBU1499176.1 hypothetical protein [Myxococcota bacterium]
MRDDLQWSSEPIILTSSGQWGNHIDVNDTTREYYVDVESADPGAFLDHSIARAFDPNAFLDHSIACAFDPGGISRSQYCLRF